MAQKEVPDLQHYLSEELGCLKGLQIRGEKEEERGEQMPDKVLLCSSAEGPRGRPLIAQVAIKEKVHR